VNSGAGREVCWANAEIANTNRGSRAFIPS
jgi:hypothetical protein